MKSWDFHQVLRVVRQAGEWPLVPNNLINAPENLNPSLTLISSFTIAERKNKGRGRPIGKIHRQRGPQQ